MFCNKAYGFDLLKEQVEFFIYDKKEKTYTQYAHLDKCLQDCGEGKKLAFRLRQDYEGFTNEADGFLDLRKNHTVAARFSYVAPYCDSALFQKVVQAIEKYKQEGDTKCLKEF